MCVQATVFHFKRSFLHELVVHSSFVQVNHVYHDPSIENLINIVVVELVVIGDSQVQVGIGSSKAFYAQLSFENSDSHFR